MILVNGVEVLLKKRFPDGTFSFKIFAEDVVRSGAVASITWYYEGEDEMAALYYIVQHIHQNPVIQGIKLFLPYCPNARMDRTHHDDEVFTLKYFAEFINSMGFRQVSVLDPHSSVVPALINRCEVVSPVSYIRKALRAIDDPNLILFYPDEGAMKRYSGMLHIPYGFGIKHRSWETGEIASLNAVVDGSINGKKVLVIDDICCRGGTFLKSAECLKKMRAKGVFLFCTHCEPTIFKGELLNTDLVDHIYTTNSIFHGEHPKITVFPVEGD